MFLGTTDMVVTLVSSIFKSHNSMLLSAERVSSYIYLFSHIKISPDNNLQWLVHRVLTIIITIVNLGLPRLPLGVFSDCFNSSDGWATRRSYQAWRVYIRIVPVVIAEYIIRYYYFHCVHGPRVVECVPLLM